MSLKEDHPYQLSRFAVVRAVRGVFVLETPFSPEGLVVRAHGLLNLLLRFARPFRPGEIYRSVEPRSRKTVAALLEAMDSRRALTEVGDSGLAEEDRNELAHWEFHDLLFHATSRRGRNPRAIGGTFRFLGVLPDEPTRPPAPACTETVALEASPECACDLKTASLFSVLERRRTVYGTAPLSLKLLGTFLYHTCRVTRSVEQGHEQRVFKVYPSGGGLHPLEVYAVVTACNGLENGLYHYDAFEHTLHRVRDLDDDVEALISDASRSTGGRSARPPVLFVITARFRRTAWKYESIAYRVILLEVGVLFQTMYLVATALGLAPCAVGTGNSTRSRN